MLRRLVVGLALSLVPLAGCEAGPCAPVGTLARCGGECTEPEGPWASCTPLHGEAGRCATGLCTPQRVPRELPLSGHVDMPTRCAAAPGSYWPPAWDGACWLDDAMPGPYGFLLSDADCDAAFAATGIPCFWSDGTVRTRSPSAVHTSCPVAAAPTTTLCGGVCGDCGSSFYPPSGLTVEDNWNLMCIGRNDARELGVCAFGQCGTLIPPSPGWQCPPTTVLADWGSTRCSCLIPPGATYGWTVPETSCIAYRDLHPDTFECRDYAWALVP